MISMIKMTNSSLNGVLVMASRIYNKSFITGSAALSTVIGLQQYGTRARNPPRTAPGSLGTLAAFTLLATNHVFADPTPPGRSMFIDAKTAQHIDAALMSPEEGFSLDQLMELAGLSVASASQDYLKRLSNDSSSSKNKRILVVCGPGNNGGDGLVAARHLKQFGHSPFVYIPFPDKNRFSSLTTQCRRAGVEVISEFPSPDEVSGYDLILDALFGFSFKGPVRDAYSPIIAAIATTNTPVLSVDIPSGWDVEKGDVYSTGFVPKAVISLTAPKLCMKGFSGLHYLGGRFVTPYWVPSLLKQITFFSQRFLPQNFADKFGFDIPSFGDTVDQV
jgi:NAD(P)H-hydrate epimerase